MEQIPRQQYHVDILLLRQAHDLVEALPAVVAADRVALVVADMTVCCHENTDRVRSYIKFQ